MVLDLAAKAAGQRGVVSGMAGVHVIPEVGHDAVSYTHLRAHETVLDLVCRLLLEKNKSHRDCHDIRVV